MKKSLQLLCLVFVFLLFPIGLWFSSFFPVDTRSYVEKKYAGWNGVLQAWICTNWEPGGSFIRWLNNCAAAFEKAHEGVYIEITPVRFEAMCNLSAGQTLLPDMVFFSPGIITDADTLMSLQTPDIIRSDLREYGKGHAFPVALSGFIWARNTAMCDHSPQTVNEANTLFLSDNTEKLFFAPALTGLLSGEDASGLPAPSVPDPGIDLGLPASSGMNDLHTQNALDLFIDGKLPCVPVNSKDIARLSRLQESGRGPDWTLTITGDLACTDQLLMAGIPAAKHGSEQAALSEEFLMYLLSEDAQTHLAEIGVCSVSGQSIHSSLSLYAEMDVLLNSRPLWLPDCFSEYSPARNADIVRSFLTGNVSAKKALSLMGFEGM